jgi:LuxR family transcriptional regulator, maltose regulon positive regulatory protein
MTAPALGAAARARGGPPQGLVARRRRARLSARLDASLDAATRLTLVSAPPGYGKSVAVAGWIADRAMPAAWVSLDSSAGDPARLARDVLSAFAATRPGATAVARAIAPGAVADVRVLADLVIDAVAADDTDLVIVLDDCHLADGLGAVALLRRLVDRMPPFGHLVLVAREDPDLPLARLRAHGALVEIRADDLRFTADEARAFLADAGVEPDPILVDWLVGRTEGWAAALQLASITLRSVEAPLSAADVMSGTHRYLIDYLGDEVMAGLDGGLQEVLAAAAVAERFTADLGALMTGRADVAALLDRAERSNLFLTPLDGQRRWFRMHGLFADYLRSRIPADERRRLHGVAAAWFDAAGMGPEAVTHALEAGDPAAATRLVAREGRAAFEAGELRTLERWIAALPLEARESDVDIASLEAWSRFYTGDLAGAAAIAEQISAIPGDRSAARGRLLVLLGLVGTTMRSDAESLARDGIELVGDDDLFRSLGLQAAGLAQLARGDVPGSLETLRAAFDAAEASGLPIAVLPAVNPLGHALVATGRRDEAEGVARRVLATYPGPRDEPLAIAWSARLTLGIALFEGGDVVEARGELDGGLAAAESLGVGREVLGWALPSIALARQATGDARGALAILERGPAPPMAFPSLAGETEARIHLAQGDLARASRWADEARTEAPEGSPLLAMLRASADTTVARVRLAEGRPADALGALEPARATFEAWGTLPDRISTLILAAVASRVAGDRESALVNLSAAIRLAAPGGYVRRFVDDGRSLLPLLGDVAGVAPAFAARVRAALRDDEAPRAIVRRGTSILVGPDGELVESLTGRELDVLRLLATGARNAQLAEDLGVSAGTAKWHVAHVLAKLGATSRTGAVVRGQELGLL